MRMSKLAVLVPTCTTAQDGGNPTSTVPPAQEPTDNIAPAAPSSGPEVPMATSTPVQYPMIPSCIRTKQPNVPDDSSIASFQSLQQGYQDIKINLTTFEEKWLKKDAPKARMWYGNLISELASKSYHHPLLTADKKNITFDTPIDGPNATLHSTLQTKLSSEFRTMMFNSKYTSSTDILNFIDSSLTLLRGNKSLATQLLSDLYQLKWTPPKTSLVEFKTVFNEKPSLVLKTAPNFAFEQVLHS